MENNENIIDVSDVNTDIEETVLENTNEDVEKVNEEVSDEEVSPDLSREEVNTLRKEIAELKEEKEIHFVKKSELGKQIRNSIRDIKGFKNNRNDLTSKVQESKKERSVLNKEISEKIKAVKILQEKKKEMFKGKKLDVSPAKVKKEIERLEYSIETEVLNINKERDVMKKIKDLKKSIENIPEVDSKLLSNLNNMSKEIDVLSKKADGIHKIIQDSARESQFSHEKLIDTSKILDSLKEEEKQAIDKYKIAKESLKEKTGKLKGHQKIVKKNAKIKRAVREEAKFKSAKADKEALREKKKMVEAKMMNGEKLTTEDFLILQSN